jgi:hypothetical protein
MIYIPGHLLKMHLEATVATGPIEAGAMGMTSEILKRGIANESLIESPMAFYDFPPPPSPINPIITPVYTAFLSPPFLLVERPQVPLDNSAWAIHLGIVP